MFRLTSLYSAVSPCDSSNMKKNSKHTRHDGLPVWHKEASADGGREVRVLTFFTCWCSNARYVGLLGGWTRFLWHRVARAKKVQWRYCFRTRERLTWSKKKWDTRGFLPLEMLYRSMVKILIMRRYSGNGILKKKCEKNAQKLSVVIYSVNGLNPGVIS